MGALTADGVTGMAASDAVSHADRAIAERVLASTGYCFWVDSDERFDAVAAVSGSGPAYVLHFLEVFQQAAQTQGFELAVARELVLRAAAGAMGLAKLGENFNVLRTRVISKRGSTEAALRDLDEWAPPQQDEVLLLGHKTEAVSARRCVPRTLLRCQAVTRQGRGRFETQADEH
ncbi:pyrroline-5-carboxylate reductase family protein [Cupriavidus sp. PET2-C1]